MSDSNESIKCTFDNAMGIIKKNPFSSFQQALHSHFFSVMFLNVNTDRRLNGFIGKQYPHLAPKIRAQKIIDNVIANVKMNHLHCLEETDGEMREMIKEHSSSNSLICQEVKYNTSDGAFSYLIISKFEVLVKVFPLTVSGERFDHTKRPEAPKSRDEKSSQEYQNYQAEILGDNFDKALVQVSFSLNGRTMHVYCAHLGLGVMARLNQSRKVVEIIKQHSIDQGIEFVFGGDINAFDPVSKTPALCVPQIEEFTNAGFEWITKTLQCTFIAYPYDIVFKMSKEEQDEYFKLLNAQSEQFAKFCEDMLNKYGAEGGALDHIFTSVGLKCSLSLVDTEQVSDHYALVMTIL